MKLIADSGSTKTLWVLIDKNNDVVKEIITDGLNPYYQTTDSVIQTLNNQLVGNLEKVDVDAVYFYGAGCAFPEKNAIIENAITHFYPSANIQVAGDLLGAARGLCGNEAGIVCILGTGSNSCFFEHREIVKNVSPLGFILGDEGSGAVLGKYLIGDYLKNQMPKHLCEAFTNMYQISPQIILERVYKQAFPNRFLASFCPFITKYKNESYIEDLLNRSFKDFFVRNVQQYNYTEYTTHFTGSIAYYFQDNLKQMATELGISVGKIEQQPMSGLIDFHLSA